MQSKRQQAEQSAAAWIAQRDVGPWSEVEAAALAAWLAQGAGHRAAYYRLNAAWQEAGRLKALGGPIITASSPALNENAEVAEIRSVVSATEGKSVKAGIARRSRGVMRLLAIAASVVLGVGLGTFTEHRDLLHRRGYTTAVGGIETVPLADGSRVTLNTDSNVRIAITQAERRVYLEKGEAFFEVAKDPRRPFIVMAGNKRLIAVGTQFSVLRQGYNVDVVVSEGVVRLEAPGVDSGLSSEGTRGRTARRQPKTVLLTAGSVAHARRSDVLVQKRSDTEIDRTLTWRTGILTFRDTPLADAVAEFNRYNTRQIVIDDPKLGFVKIGGIFRATDLDPFVHLLEEGFHIRSTVEEERIVLAFR
jgi:transmembrane sensor